MHYIHVHRKGTQVDVSVGLNTLYVTKSHDKHAQMVTLRSSVLESGYITTISAKAWYDLAEQIERALYCEQNDIKVYMPQTCTCNRVQKYTHMLFK